MPPSSQPWRMLQCLWTCDLFGIVDEIFWLWQFLAGFAVLSNIETILLVRRLRMLMTELEYVPELLVMVF